MKHLIIFCDDVKPQNRSTRKNWLLLWCLEIYSPRRHKLPIWSVLFWEWSTRLQSQSLAVLISELSWNTLVNWGNWLKLKNGWGGRASCMYGNLCNVGMVSIIINRSNLSSCLILGVSSEPLNWDSHPDFVNSESQQTEAEEHSHYFLSSFSSCLLFLLVCFPIQIRQHRKQPVRATKIHQYLIHIPVIIMYWLIPERRRR